jgi:predicted nucleic acid-binding protein
VHRWHALDEDLTSAACALAGELRLRGADAVYAAVAARMASTLITLDREIQVRAGQHVSGLTPELWIAAQSS